MLRDRPALRRLWTRIDGARTRGRPCDRDQSRLDARLADSAHLLQERLSARPAIQYPQDLPVVAARAGLLDAIRDHPVVVVCGETGSGKSTQLPKLCLELGRGVAGMIGHTQPRRIAARSLCRRIGQELGSQAQPSEAVGYKVRHADTTHAHTLVKLMTDGVLLAEIERDPDLLAYDTLVIDEAHERSCNIDFLLGYVRRLLRRRRDLRVVVTSATIDPRRFAEHFADPSGAAAPVLEVSGRSFPVEVRYRPPTADDDPVQAVVSALAEIDTEPPGDVLVFLPTERDIRAVHRGLRGRSVTGEQVLPLYGRLSPADQDRVFRPGGRARRIVLSTNVAETSVTVPGIRYVVDTGTARVARFSAKSGMQRLPIEPVSQASADQRAGRCGRVAEGVCVRLYAEEDYLERDRFTLPEIRRTNLAGVILRMKALGLGDCAAFPFLDPPKPAAVRAGVKVLHELGALDDGEQLTKMGRRMARLPVEPRIARMLLEAQQQRVLDPVLVIAACLEVGDPRLRPAGSEASADAAHEELVDAGSDFITLLRLWGFHRMLRSTRSRSAYEQECKARYLSPNRLREWGDTYRQLRDEMGAGGPGGRGVGQEWTETQRDAIHRSLLAGLLSRVACRDKGPEYLGAGRQKLFLWPGSTLFRGKPAWVVAAELVETGKPYARTLAPVDPGWIEELGGELCQRAYGPPRWSARHGRVVASERVRLFGLPVKHRKAIRYSRVDRAEARRVFIREALVGGELGGQAEFLQHNLALRAQADSLEERLRRRGLTRDAAVSLAFYQERVPDSVHDRPSLLRWLEEEAKAGRSPLDMVWSDVTQADERWIHEHGCPDRLDLGSLDLPLQYRYRPGEADDGVTLQVPVEAVSSLDPARLDWLVPARLQEKLTELIRGLPKDLRRSFAPAPDSARMAAQRMTFGKGDFYEAAAAALGAARGVTLLPEALRAVHLPDFLRMNVRVVDAAGQPLHTSRSLAELRATLRDRLAAAVRDESAGGWQRSELTSWGDTPDLPKRVLVDSRGLRLAAYPALVDEGATAGVRLFAAPWLADVEHARGLVRLAVLEFAPRLRAFSRYDRALQAVLRDLGERFKASPSDKELRGLVLERVVSLALPEDLADVRDRAEVERVFTRAWDQLDTAKGRAVEVFGQVVSEWRSAEQAVCSSAERPGRASINAESQAALEGLTAADFASHWPWFALRRLPVYLAAVRVRLERYQGRVDQDRRAAEALAPFRKAWAELVRASPAMHRHPEMQCYRWMLEEAVVAHFAPQHAGPSPVGEEDLRTQWRRASTAG
ncbi:MAG: ATP-dependent RNA helicase HrpA [Planctomycetota bacterium]